MPGTGPPEQPEDSKGESAKGKKKAGRTKEAKRYILTHPTTFAPAAIVSEASIGSEIEDFAEENDLQPSDVAVYELGKRMRVDVKIRIEPMDKS